MYKKNYILGGVFYQNGAPGKIRTPDPLVRSQVLYPTELQAHKQYNILLVIRMTIIVWSKLIPSYKSSSKTCCFGII